MDNIINTELKLVINKIFMNDENDYMDINVKSFIIILYSMILNNLTVSDINKIKNIINIQLLQDDIPQNKIFKKILIQYQLSTLPDITYISCGSAPINRNEFFPQYLIERAKEGKSIKAFNFDPDMSNTTFKPHEKAIKYLKLKYPEKIFKNIQTEFIDFFYTDDRSVEIYNIKNTLEPFNFWFIIESFKLCHTNSKDLIVYLENECASNEKFHNLERDLSTTWKDLNIINGKRSEHSKHFRIYSKDENPQLFVYDYDTYAEIISTINIPKEEAKKNVFIKHFDKEIQKIK
jgi:hypothetical protein